MKINRVVINTDGSADPNPGPAAIGATIKDRHGKLIASISQPIGWATSNQAEYRAIIAALEKAVQLGAAQVEIRSDSELVVRQLNGRYRVKKATLRLLCQQVISLLSHFRGVTITHVPREQNTEADSLASAALNFTNNIA